MSSEFRPLNTEIDVELSTAKERVRGEPICLIIPPSPFLADERVFPFLGILKVASELRNNGNHVEVLDLSGYKNYEDIVEEYVSSSGIEVFGITATTPQIPSAVKVQNRIKEINPRSSTILGGPHVTLAHTAMGQDIREGREARGTYAFRQLAQLFDKLVVGDGETATYFALDKSYPKKIIDAGNLKSPFFMKRGELDHFPFPARDLIDLDSYHYAIDGKRAFSVIAQLGCPFECGFCGGRDSQVFRMARTRSNENVISEIEEVVKASIDRGNPYGAVMFYDDELNIVPTGLENLCMGLVDMQERLGIEMGFRGFVKAELLTQEQANLMYKAGFRILLSGVESGSNLILDTMKKHTSREINSRCVEYAHTAGLRFKALMSIGHPGESEETINESLDWALKNLTPNFDDIDWTIITQYPGSPYYDRSVPVPEKNAWLYQITHKAGKVMNLWSSDVDFTKQAEYYKGVPGDYTAYVWTDTLSPDDLVKLREKAERITRSYLKLAPITSVPQLQFEHSMGQGLPANILRKSRII